VPPRQLSRAAIVDACLQLLERAPGDGRALTLRRVGAQLGVDATAIYRHFRDKDELLRAVGDRIHERVLEGGPGPDAGWRDVIRGICLRLRAAHLARPDLARFVRAGPALQGHELDVTEALLVQLGAAGLDAAASARAYHALVELTVGSAAIDADVASLPAADQRATWASWRRAYALLDPERYPASVAASAHLYPGTADDRFADALDRLLDTVAAEAGRSSTRSVDARELA